MWDLNEAKEIVYMASCDNLDQGYCSRSVSD